jgi:hypothetical protein
VAVWVVVLEAIADRDARTGFDEESLDALAGALAEHFPVIAGTGRSYETELWVEDSMASGALLTAERLVQAAAREIGLATTEIVRAEVRSARAIEAGIINWGTPPGQKAAAAKKAPAKKKAVAAKRAPTKRAPAKKARSRQ